MKISVVIPTYNSAAFIGTTLESVLNQTLPAKEILVLDDGSTDDTVAILRTYEPRIKVLQQKNQGVAAARNVLAREATRDLVAFLDHDDLWHPGYLEAQWQLFMKYPDVVAGFTGHVDFQGAGIYQWNDEPIDDPIEAQLLPPLKFFERYSEATGLFGSMSFCCVPKHVLKEMGDEPFRISGADDCYLNMRLPLMGTVVYKPSLLVAYRFTQGAQSGNRLKNKTLILKVFELLHERYCTQKDSSLRRAFEGSFALSKRGYGKLLMGARKAPEARRQFKEAMKISHCPASKSKSFALWLMTFLPTPAQPAWPTAEREFAIK
jgi:glycosyltransferase involved in cell wall biosynthesis